MDILDILYVLNCCVFYIAFTGDENCYGISMFDFIVTFKK